MKFNTYNGFKTNPNIGSAFYCYTLYDIVNNKFYSGVKTNHKNTNVELMTTYFTSSRDSLFTSRLKSNPKEFIYYVEFFETKEDAFLAEKLYHKKYNVAKRQDYYNIQNSSGSSCGSGMTVCVNDNNETYLVSSIEYLEGGHKHISSDKMNVVDLKSGKLIKINIKDYDSTLHKKELEDTVCAYDKIDNKNIRLTKDMFDSDKSRYHGVTVGKTVVREVDSDKVVMVDNETYRKNSSKYEGLTKGKKVVIELATGTTMQINTADFNSSIHKELLKGRVVVVDEKGIKLSIKVEEYDPKNHTFITAGFVSCREISTGKTLQITKEVFNNNPDIYEGVAKNTITAYDLQNHEYVRIHKEIFKSNKDRYCGTTNKKAIEDKLKYIVNEN